MGGSLPATPEAKMGGSLPAMLQAKMGGRDYSEPWSHHCIPVCVTERDPRSQRKKRMLTIKDD